MNHSISSNCMSRLLAWRNPLGAQDESPIVIETNEGIRDITHTGRVRYTRYFAKETEGWKVPNWPLLIGKAIVTEIGLCLLAATAAVETAAYLALTLLSILLSPITTQPCRFFAQLSQSSINTIIWALGDALFHNWFYPNLLTQERYAMAWAQDCCSSFEIRMD